MLDEFLTKGAVLLAAGTIAGTAWGVSRTFDLRPPAGRSGLRGAAAAPGDSGVLARTRLAAGVTRTSALQPGDELVFSLFDGETVKLRLTERTPSPLGGETFLAAAADDPDSKTAVVLRTAEGLSADIQDIRNGTVISLVSTATGTTLVKRNPRAGCAEPCRTVVPDLSAARAARGAASARRLRGVASDQPNMLIDVLVAFDEPAAEWAAANGGGITNFATLSVQKMNTVLANNGLGSDFRFRLVDAMKVSVQGGTDFDAILEATRSGREAWAGIPARRNAVGADVVVTLVDTGSAYGTTGLGYALQDLSADEYGLFAESAYSVCSVRAVAEGHAMTHEVGHNLGAGHATAVNASVSTPGPQLFGYSAGHYFTGTNNVKYHTVMAYNNDGYDNYYTAIPYFSSPERTHEGVAMGDATHDNARTVAATYAAAAQWRAQVIPTSYDVFFAPADETLFTASLTVTLTPGKAGLPVYYTLDGSEPTDASTLYTGPFAVTDSVTVRARSYNESHQPGPVYSARYRKSGIATALDASQLNWLMDTEGSWILEDDSACAYAGGLAVKSAPLPKDGEVHEAWLETTVTGPARLSFRYRAQMYSSCLRVSVDGVVMEERDEEKEAWTLAEIDIPAGAHTLRFTYVQGGYYYDPTYCGVWLDTIEFNAYSRPPGIAPVSTASESNALRFQGSQTVTLSAPEGHTGRILYTLDGTDPVGERGLTYTAPFVLTESTRVRAVFVEPGLKPSTEVDVLYLERHPLVPGEWTSDVEGVTNAAAANAAARLLAVHFGSAGTQSYNRKFLDTAESRAFTDWAAQCGVYLVSADASLHPDALTATAWFLRLHRAWSGDQAGYSYSQFYFAHPAAPETPVGIGQGWTGGAFANATAQLAFDGSVRSLADAFGQIMDMPVLAPPELSLTSAAGDDAQRRVELTNPNGTGDIYYTLDGTVPSPSNGTRYTTAFSVTDPVRVLRASVWPADSAATLPSVAIEQTGITAQGLAGERWQAPIALSGAHGTHEIPDITLYCDEADEPRHTLTRTDSGWTWYTFDHSVWFSWTAPGTGKVRLRACCTCNGYLYDAPVAVYAQDALTANSWPLTNCVVSANKAQAYAEDYCWTVVTFDAEEGKTYRFASCVMMYEGGWTPAGKITLEWQGDLVSAAGETSGTVPVPYAWLETYCPSASTRTAADYATLAETTGANGRTLWESYLLGLDPTNAASVFTASVSFTNGVPCIAWNPTNANIHALGWDYVVKGVTNLTEDVWLPQRPGQNFFKVMVVPVSAP